MKFLSKKDKDGVFFIYDTEDEKVIKVVDDISGIHGVLNDTDCIVFNKLGIKLCSSLEFLGEGRGSHFGFSILESTSDIFVFQDGFAGGLITLDMLIKQGLSYVERKDNILTVTCSDEVLSYEIVDVSTFDSCVARLKFLSTLEPKVGQPRSRRKASKAIVFGQYE